MYSLSQAPTVEKFNPQPIFRISNTGLKLGQMKDYDIMTWRPVSRSSSLPWRTLSRMM